MTTTDTASDRFCKDHDDYFEVVFEDNMTIEDIRAVQECADNISEVYKKAGKPLLVFVNIYKRTTHDKNLFLEKVKLLDTDGLHAVAFYGPGEGIIYNLVNTVISSYSSVLPMKYFSDQDKALEWLRTNR